MAGLFNTGLGGYNQEQENRLLEQYKKYYREMSSKTTAVHPWAIPTSAPTTRYPAEVHMLDTIKSIYAEMKKLHEAEDIEGYMVKFKELTDYIDSISPTTETGEITWMGK